jgi:hypothetical protein
MSSALPLNSDIARGGRYFAFAPEVDIARGQNRITEMNRIMDLSAKPFGDLTLDEVIYLHVAGRLHELTGDFHVTSSLEQILTSMRSAISRKNSQFYGPAMCAFAILDQLGTVMTGDRRIYPARRRASSGHFKTSVASVLQARKLNIYMHFEMVRCTTLRTSIGIKKAIGTCSDTTSNLAPSLNCRRLPGTVKHLRWDLTPRHWSVGRSSSN